MSGQYDHIAGIYESIFPLSDAAFSFMRERAGGKGSKLLDAGCGTGELALRLQQAGFEVTAFDLESSMIGRAEAGKRRLGLSGPEFLVMGMEEMGERLPAGAFSLVSCIGNTIAHLEDRATVTAFLRACARLLLPGGTLALQLLDYRYILESRPEQLPPLTAEGYRFLRAYDYRELPGHILFTTRLETAGGELVEERRVRLYPVTGLTLEDILTDLGFSDLRFFGGFSGEPPGGGRLPLVLSARNVR